MTDNEIIKALECCTNDKGNGRCVDCPLANYSFEECADILRNASKHLINCQKAIIEKSEKVEHFADKTIETANAEIERLEKVLNGRDQLINALNKCYKQAKSEAIKEFAERLKYFIIPQKADGYTREIVLKRDIDDLVKEMTEVRKNEMPYMWK